MEVVLMLKVGSLFAGIGGIDLAFSQANFSISWANEIDSKACETYSANFNHHIICNDIKKIKKQNLASVDLLAGGFPCQAFSVAGYRRGFSDDRGTLVFDLLRIAKALKPKILFLENVKNLQSHEGGATLAFILDQVKMLGYTNTYKVLNTAEYSVLPQNRERLYIVSFIDKDACSRFEFPQKKEKRESIQDILEHDVDPKFYYTNSQYYQALKKEVKNRDTCYQWRRHYVRENKNNLCPTLTANMGTGGHNVPLVLDHKDIRKLTPRECARLQGFPDSFVLPNHLSLSSLYKQIGNSVSVPIVQAIAENISNALTGKDLKRKA